MDLEVKDMVQGNVVKKGASLRRLREVYELGMSMKVDLTTELVPIHNAINAAEAWIVEYERLLIELGMHNATVEVSASLYNDTADQKNDGHYEDGTDESGRRTGVYHSGAVDIFHITRAANASSGIAASFEELTALRGLNDKCNEWMRRFKIMCPARHQSKRKSTSSTHASNVDAKPAIDDLQTLLEQMEPIGVAFPDRNKDCLRQLSL